MFICLPLDLSSLHRTFRLVYTEVRTTTNQPNLTFSVNNQYFHTIADSGSFYSILPFQTFKQLNLNEKDLDKSQQFSIHSATEVKNNAVLGTINLNICIENTDDTRQILTQKFLILRASCTLNLTLLGHDFLTKNEAKLLYKPSISIKAGPVLKGDPSVIFM